MTSHRHISALCTLAAAGLLAASAPALAQGSRLNIGSPPSRLNQKGPVPKLGNPAAPLTGDPSLHLPNNPPIHPGHHHGGGVGLGYPHNYPYYWIDGYQRFRRPQYYDPNLWLSYDDWWNWSRSTYQGPLLVEQVRKYDPEVIDEKPAPPRVVDEALEALRREDYKVAADIYARRVAEQERTEAEHPPKAGLSDREQQRLLAVALVGDNRMDDALHHALQAYAEDASLRRRPILGTSVIPSAAERTDLVRRAVTYAQRRDTPDEAWFLVAMLMEADDRPDDARRMLARASILIDAPSPTTTTRPDAAPQAPPASADLPGAPDAAAEPAEPRDG